MEQITEYTLTADEQAMINPLIETVENLQRDAQAILRAITRLRGLEGQWNLNGNKLIKMGAAPVLPLPASPALQPAGTADHNGNG
jgi:hypothetical protein